MSGLVTNPNHIVIKTVKPDDVRVYGPFNSNFAAKQWIAIDRKYAKPNTFRPFSDYVITQLVTVSRL